MTDFLTKVDAELVASNDPARLSHLLGSKACYVARAGDIRLAEDLALDLRRRFRDQACESALVWAMLVDGLSLYFDSLASTARDRVERAYSVSHLVGSLELTQVCAAWLAHLEFERNNFERMASMIVTILDDPRGVSPEAALRVGLVMGDAFLFAGDRRSSSDWYRLAHTNAIQTGDRVAVGALMYNRAAFSVSLIRVERVLGRSSRSEEELSVASTELASAKAFEGAIRVASLPQLIPLVEARILILRKQYSSARSLLEGLVEQVSRSKRVADAEYLLGDIALCAARSGDTVRALGIVDQLMASDALALDADDEVVVLSQLLEVCAENQLTSHVPELTERLRMATSRYDANVAELRRALASIGKPSRCVN